MIKIVFLLTILFSTKLKASENERPYITLDEAKVYCNYAQTEIIKIGSRFDFNQDGIVNVDDVKGINRILMKLREPALGINCIAVNKLLSEVQASASFCEVATAGVLNPPFSPGLNIIFNQVFTNGAVGRGKDSLFENPGKGFIDFESLAFTPYLNVEPGVEIDLSFWNIIGLRASKGSYLQSAIYYKTEQVMSVPTSNVQLLFQNPFVYSDQITKKCSPASDPGHRITAFCEIAGSNGMVISNSILDHRLSSTSYGYANWCE